MLLDRRHGTGPDQRIEHKGEIYVLTPVHRALLRFLASGGTTVGEAASKLLHLIGKFQESYNYNRVGQITKGNITPGLATSILYKGPVRKMTERGLLTCSAYDGRWSRGTRGIETLKISITGRGSEIVALLPKEE